MQNNEKRREEKKKHSLSAINTRIHRENRAQPAPPLPSTVFNSVFGISNFGIRGGGGGGAGRRSAANET